MSVMLAPTRHKAREDKTFPRLVEADQQTLFADYYKITRV
jgi:hypothetical protein